MARATHDQYVRSMHAVLDECIESYGTDHDYHTLMIDMYAKLRDRGFEFGVGDANAERAYKLLALLELQVMAVAE